MIAVRAGPRLPLDRLLGLCACPLAAPDLPERVAEAVSRYEAWDTLPAAAESHGIAPLVEARLAACPGVPRPVLADLKGLAMRHRRASQVRGELLAELVDAFARRGVPLLLLKGAALAYSVYAEPRLRAMRDLDLLVRVSDLPAAGDLLRALGYAAEDEATWNEPGPHWHHQEPRVRRVGSVEVTVEVHRQLGIRDTRARRTLEVLEDEATAVAIGGVQARTLGPLDMLVHVHYHGFATPLSWPDRLRLVSASDLFACAAAYGALEPAILRARAPRAYAALRWLGSLAPWPADVAARLELPPAACEVGTDYCGWPRERSDERADRMRHWADTWRPPPFWLRMRHGGGPGALGGFAAWCRHVKELL